MENFGFQVLSCGSIPCSDVYEMDSIPPKEWIDLTLKNLREEADAYLLSCTAIRTAEVIEELEDHIGKPVITSNSAALWHSLRTLNIDDNIERFGRLFST